MVFVRCNKTACTVKRNIATFLLLFFVLVNGLLLCFIVTLHDAGLHHQLLSQLFSGQIKVDKYEAVKGFRLGKQAVAVDPKLHVNENPLITVLVPVYDDSKFVKQVMETLRKQTYPCLEIVVSIEPSEDADQSEAILQLYRSDYPQMRLLIRRHSHRLQHVGHTNWLLSQVKGEYYSYMQCDDTLPPNYYEELARCLKVNPEAVSCYPRVYRIKEGKNISRKAVRQRSIHGPTSVRIERVIRDHSWIPFHGLVRRPVHGSMRRFFVPRLHKIYTSSDIVATVKLAIAGNLIEARVPYYKYVRMTSISNSQFFNATILSVQDMKLGVVDEFTRSYNLAHSYAASSKNLSLLCSEKLTRTIYRYLKKFRNRDESVLKRSQKEVASVFNKRIHQLKRVAVLGAGIQGCLMALMFRKHGHDVTLIDKSHDIMNRASIAGGSRIHLGLEYSNDPSMVTATYILESALRFSSYLEYLVDRKIDWSQLKSERLTCLLAKSSLVKPEKFEQYAEKLGNIYENLLSGEPELSYLGECPHMIISKTQVPREVNSSYVSAAYKSIEVCILTKKLKEIIRDALYKHSVNIVFNRTIQDVKRNAAASNDRLGRLRVISNIGEHDYDAVVNCLWEGRAAIDRKMGLHHRVNNENCRLKASVCLPSMELHAGIPSISVIDGGDFVRYGPNDQVYFSWDPASPSVVIQNETVMQQFESHANFHFPAMFETNMIEGHRTAFQTIFPGINSSFFDSAILRAGYVVVKGNTDIADPESLLHQQSDPPNLVVDGYVSVKTQKLSTAPYHVYLLENELFKMDLLVPDKQGDIKPSSLSS